MLPVAIHKPVAGSYNSALEVAKFRCVQAAGNENLSVRQQSRCVTHCARCSCCRWLSTYQVFAPSREYIPRNP